MRLDPRQRLVVHYRQDVEAWHMRLGRELSDWLAPSPDAGAADPSGEPWRLAG